MRIKLAIVGVILVAGAVLASNYIINNAKPVIAKTASYLATTTNTKIEIAAAKKPSAADILLQSEKQLEQKLCEILPTTGSRMPFDMLEVDIHLPSDLSTQMANIGDTIVFPTNYYIFVTRDYKNEKYVNCLYKTINHSIKECYIPLTVNFADGASEEALIKMTFTGELGKYIPQNPVPADTTVGDHSVSNNQYIGMDPMPMLTRNSCSVSFQKPCPTKANSVLCGQCDYKFTNLEGTNNKNLGQCFYCASNQKCTWGSGGICGSYSCINSGNTNNTKKKQTNYFIGCSNCQKAGYQRSYNYSGTNRNTCLRYYNTCRQCGYTDMKTNCL